MSMAVGFCGHKIIGNYSSVFLNYLQHGEGKMAQLGIEYLNVFNLPRSSSSI